MAEEKKKEQPAGKKPSSAKRARFVDPFDAALLEHQRQARGLARDYAARLHEVQATYEREVREALQDQEPGEVEETLNRAHQRYAEALRKARDEANQAAEHAFHDYVGRLRDAWAEVDPKSCDLPGLSFVAESMVTVAGRASGAIPS